MRACPAEPQNSQLKSVMHSYTDVDQTYTVTPNKKPTTTMRRSIFKYSVFDGLIFKLVVPSNANFPTDKQSATHQNFCDASSQFQRPFRKAL